MDMHSHRLPKELRCVCGGGGGCGHVTLRLLKNTYTYKPSYMRLHTWIGWFRGKGIKCLHHNFFNTHISEKEFRQITFIPTGWVLPLISVKKQGHFLALNESLTDSSLLVNSSQGVKKQQQQKIWSSSQKYWPPFPKDCQQWTKLLSPKMPMEQFTTNPIIIFLAWIP